MEKRRPRSKAGRATGTGRFFFAARWRRVVLLLVAAAARRSRPPRPHPHPQPPPSAARTTTRQTPPCAPRPTRRSCRRLSDAQGEAWRAPQRPPPARRHRAPRPRQALARGHRVPIVLVQGVTESMTKKKALKPQPRGARRTRACCRQQGGRGALPPCRRRRRRPTRAAAAPGEERTERPPMKIAARVVGGRAQSCARGKGQCRRGCGAGTTGANGRPIARARLSVLAPRFRGRRCRLRCRQGRRLVVAVEAPSSSAPLPSS